MTPARLHWGLSYNLDRSSSAVERSLLVTEKEEVSLQSVTYKDASLEISPS